MTEDVFRLDMLSLIPLGPFSSPCLPQSDGFAFVLKVEEVEAPQYPTSMGGVFDLFRPVEVELAPTVR